MREQDIDNYKKGREIAEQLMSVARQKDKTNLDDYPAIMNMLTSNEYASKLLEDITDEQFMENLAINHTKNRYSADRLIRAISIQKRRKDIIRICKISSLTAGIASVLTILFVLYSTNDKSIVITASDNLDVTVPTLVLSTGENINLANANNIIGETNTTIVKQSNNISYELANSAQQDVIYNKLITPKQYIYTVILADSTEVTLNANSELVYPVVFNDSIRRVHLKGEAYFKVKKNGKPFIVDCKDVDVRVHGTQFNINSYGENTVQTFLVSGSVSVTYNATNVMIKPHQLSIVDIGMGVSTVIDSSTLQYVAWLDNNFYFENRNAIETLENIASWYGISFHYNKELLSKNYIDAKFSRLTKESDVINTLSNVLNLKFIKTGIGKYDIE